jgi:putative membrane protein insertion efficiency factor
MKKVEGRRQNENVLRRVRHFFCLLPSAFCILLVRVYQLALSPAKTFLLGPAGRCRFEPSCSQYAVEALKTHGAAAGSWLAAKRVCRCHPWGGCGEDPVPAVKSNIQSLKAKVSPSSLRFGTAQSLKSKDPAPEFRIPNAGFRI